MWVMGLMSSTDLKPIVATVRYAVKGVIHQWQCLMKTRCEAIALQQFLQPFQMPCTTSPAQIITVVDITSCHRSISQRFFKLTAHYSKWSVRMIDHMFMVAQQLYSQRNTRRKAGRLFQRSLFVGSAVLSVSRIEWRLCRLLALSIVHYEERQRLTGGSGRR